MAITYCLRCRLNVVIGDPPYCYDCYVKTDGEPWKKAVSPSSVGPHGGQPRTVLAE